MNFSCLRDDSHTKPFLHSHSNIYQPLIVQLNVLHISTRIWYLPSMGLRMGDEVSFLRKTLPTFRTEKWSLSSVSSLVDN